MGLPVLEVPSATQRIADGDTVSVDYETGAVTNHDTDDTLEAEPLPPFVQKIVDAGGLVAYGRSLDRASE